LLQWFDDAKQDLLDSRLCIDQEVRDSDGKLVSELDFRSEEVIRRWVLVSMSLFIKLIVKF
jgi:hypothetical protein